ncbi:MAG: gamma-glutamyltransferase [bacterium]
MINALFKPPTLSLLLSFLLSLFFVFYLSSAQANNNTTVAAEHTKVKTKSVKQAAIASAHPLATQAGQKILLAGGNAFDAAITVASVLAVVEPYSSGFGGGGFWLLQQANKKAMMLDGREKAPERATADMYLDENGEVIPKASLNGAKAAGIPGMPAALVWLAENRGNLPLAKSLQPAIQFAEEGFPVDKIYQKMVGFRQQALLASPAATGVFLENKDIPKLGKIIKQPDLAKTLKALAQHGQAGFYQGEVAKKLVAGVTAAGGIWTEKDLADYQVVVRPTIQFKYRDMTITSVNLPSSGGIVLAQIFNVLSHYSLDKYSEADQLHLLVEAMRRAYRDRAEYLGDSDYVKVPIERLISTAYSKTWQQSIQLDQATASAALNPSPNEGNKGTDTTHYSIIDQQGNRVAATLSINYPFGSCFMPPETGILLNNEMDDFSIKVGEPNAYGLVGNQANAIAAGKRMLSSMTPTFVENKQRLAVIGTPGGSRIITMVLLGLLHFEQGKSAEVIVNAPRFHHQYLPDTIQLEPAALPHTLREALSKKGHNFTEKEDTWGNMQIVIQDKATKKLSAAADSRGIGQALVFDVPSDE